MKRAVHFGAGAIGRGFIGELLFDSDFSITFVDVNEEILGDLNNTHSYKVHYIGGAEEEKIIEPVNGLSPIQEEDKVIQAIAECDILTTSVWAENLPKVAGVIAKGLLQRKTDHKEKLNILACENALFASNILKQALLESKVEITEEDLEQLACFPNTAVDRIAFDALQDGEHIVKVGVDFELVIEEFNLVDPTEKPIQGAIYTDNLMKYLERKIYILNCSHATSGYLGQLKGYEFIQEALGDGEIKEDVLAGVRESADGLALKHGFDRKELEDYIDAVISRFMTPGVQDSIVRVCRSPIRKLAATDRLVGPALICEKYGLENKFLAKGIAAAFLFKNPEDEQAVEIENYIQDQGIEKAIIHFTQLDSNSQLYANILEQYKRLAK